MLKYKVTFQKEFSVYVEINGMIDINKVVNKTIKQEDLVDQLDDCESKWHFKEYELVSKYTNCQHEELDGVIYSKG